MKVRPLGVVWVLAAWLLAAALAWAADLVDLNTAPVDVIARIAGVGRELAQKIVAHRIYASMAELSKAGLSPDQIKQLSLVATVKQVQNEPTGGLGGTFSEVGGASKTVFVASYNQGPKKRVAVLNFDYATVAPSVKELFGSDVDVGKGFADMLVRRLAQDGTYTVVEPKALNKILAEQSFSNEHRADALTASRIGKLLGVDAVIVGSITNFGRDDKTTGSGSNTGDPNWGHLGHLDKAGDSKAVVGITTRMIDVNTGEILALADGRGEATRSGKSVMGGGVQWAAGGGAFDMASSNFGQTIIGEAANASVTNVAAKLDEEAAKIPSRPLAIDGLVADVNGDKLVLNIGVKDGLKAGDVLRVVRVSRELRDPDTGKALKRLETDLGRVTITSVDNASSEGTYSGAAGAKVGDSVKRD